MANSYISLNGKRYRIRRSRFDHPQDDYQIVETTVTGKTISQRLGFTDEMWGWELLVPYSSGDANYGTVDELEAAAALAAGYCAYIDPFGGTANVFIEKPVNPQPVTHDLEGWYRVGVTLRKRQT